MKPLWQRKSNMHLVVTDRVKVQYIADLFPSLEFLELYSVIWFIFWFNFCSCLRVFTYAQMCVSDPHFGRKIRSGRKVPGERVLCQIKSSLANPLSIKSELLSCTQMTVGCANDLRSEMRWTPSWVSKPERRLRRDSVTEASWGWNNMAETVKPQDSLFSLGPSISDERGPENSQGNNVRENAGVCRLGNVHDYKPMKVTEKI